MIRFDTPWWLAALPLAALVVWLAVRSSRPTRAHAAATWLRAFAVACLVLSLAGPRVDAGGRDLDVAFLVDASDSVAGGEQQARDWIRKALAARGRDDRVALARFGRDPRLEFGLRSDPAITEASVVVDGSASDLARAVRLGQGVVGSEHRRRIVLLTDGRQTQGDLLGAAAALAEAGIRLDVVPLAGGIPADVLVEEVLAPSEVREGESFDVTAVIRNTGGAPAQVVVEVISDGEPVERREVTARPGRTEVAVAQTAESGGTLRYEARLASAASAVPANDVGRAAVRVSGPPKVLVFEGMEGLGGDLATGLRASGVDTEVRSAQVEAFPGLDELLAFDSVVLVDVPAATLGETGIATIDTFVREAGHGLVAVAGEHSFGMGDYEGTPLEDLLPVFARVTDPRRRPPVAEALVVDTSGSMAACHCATEEMGGAQMDEGGVNKTDISKEAVARAARSLDAIDELGVLAFNTTSEWVIPLQQVPSEQVVDEGLARLHPSGNTDIPQAIREAIDGLRDTEARLRHIVLFSDGFTENAALIDVAREAAEAGITLSVVATGEGPPELQQVLRQMAEVGGGRYYPGRDLASIPDIIALEVRFAARPIVNEGLFVPAVTALSPATEDLREAPPLRGFLATTPKPTAQTFLRVGSERDPLLASWQAGLGTATAWTSDVTARWASEWVNWDGYAQFWANVVKATFPADDDTSAQVRAVATADGVDIELSSAAAWPADTDASVTVVAPDGQRTQVPLERVAVDRYTAVVDTGGDSAVGRSGAVPEPRPGGVSDRISREGVYAASVRVRSGGELLFSDTVTAIRSYSPEYALTAAPPGLLEEAAGMTGGAVGIAPAEAFSAEGVEPGMAWRALWPALAFLAAVAMVTDLALRRLRLERADVRRAKAWLRARVRTGRAGRRGGGSDSDGPGDEHAGSLLAAKARARAARERGDGAAGRG